MPQNRWISALAIVGAVALSACSANGASTSPQTGGPNAASTAVHRGIPFVPAGMLRPAVRRPAGTYPTNKTLLFESDQTALAINVYNYAKAKKNAAPIASLAVTSGCPYNLAMDSKGDVFVVDNCGGNDIEEFAPGQTTPSTIITDGISDPLGIAIDKKGTLYVSNYPAAIQVYKAGATSPSETITSGSLENPFGLSLDKKGDLFIADFGADQVFKVPAGSTTVQSMGLQDLVEPIATAVDLKSGDLWVTDGSGAKVNVYAAGQTTPKTTYSDFAFPYAIGVANQVAASQRGVAGISDLDNHSVSLIKPGAGSPFALVTNGVSTPTGVLVAKP